MRRIPPVLAPAARLLVIAALLTVPAFAQRTTTPTSFNITGRIIVPLAHFQDLFEVLLIENLEQTFQATVADSQGRYRFTNVPRGTYYVTVNLEGFEPVRQRVDLGNGADTIVNIILDFKDERIVKGPEDYSGEESEVIDAAELSKKYPSRVTEELKTADREIREGAYIRALARLEPILREYPDLYDAHRLIGVVYQKQKRYRDAESEYRTAADLKPTSAAPLINLGSLYVEEAEATTNRGSAATRKILNQALASLDAAVKMKPDAAFGFYLMGVTYYRTSFYEEAEEHLKHTLALAPGLTYAHLALANVYIKMQEWTNAITQLDAVLASSPKTETRIEVEAMRSKLVTRSQARVR